MIWFAILYNFAIFQSSTGCLHWWLRVQNDGRSFIYMYGRSTNAFAHCPTASAQFCISAQICDAVLCNQSRNAVAEKHSLNLEINWKFIWLFASLGELLPQHLYHCVPTEDELKRVAACSEEQSLAPIFCSIFGHFNHIFVHRFIKNLCEITAVLHFT